MNQNNNKEIHNDCINCRWQKQCTVCSEMGGFNQECYYKIPYQAISPDWFCSFKSNNVPTKNYKLSNYFIRNKYMYEDIIPSTYESYANFINNTLSQIRLGQAAIVFYDYQIKELLRFEPELHMCEYDSIFYVWLPKLEKKFT